MLDTIPSNNEVFSQELAQKAKKTYLKRWDVFCVMKGTSDATPDCGER